eukprot:7377295-Prymnesium_polylepis.3
MVSVEWPARRLRGPLPHLKCAVGPAAMCASIRRKVALPLPLTKKLHFGSPLVCSLQCSPFDCRKRWSCALRAASNVAAFFASRSTARFAFAALAAAMAAGSLAVPRGRRLSCGATSAAAA